MSPFFYCAFWYLLPGTLYAYLDNCVTSSGKRLLRKWLCHPLKSVEAINNRLDVVEDILVHPEMIPLIAQYLRKIPDLERLLGRIRASVQSSASLLLPLFGKKVLKQRVSIFYFNMEVILKLYKIWQMFFCSNLSVQRIDSIDFINPFSLTMNVW